MFPNGNGGSGGGTDLTKFRPGYVWATSASGTLTPILSVQGSGILVSISQVPVGSNTGSIRVTVDGNVVFSDSQFSTSSSSATFMYAFNQSLIVEHSGSTTSLTKVSYLVN
jgi:hypothetical protein